MPAAILRIFLARSRQRSASVLSGACGMRITPAQLNRKLTSICELAESLTVGSLWRRAWAASAQSPVSSFPGPASLVLPEAARTVVAGGGPGGLSEFIDGNRPGVRFKDRS
jgi:hypothetical protein